ncbi:MAG TPA: hypothetical protein PLQ00_11915, partial [Thermoguttaceae bacterium]|nr:hypothetical protein [Thermoguttaceae bacterium]
MGQPTIPKEAFHNVSPSDQREPRKPITQQIFIQFCYAITISWGRSGSPKEFANYYMLVSGVLQLWDFWSLPRVDFVGMCELAGIY